MRNGTGSHFLMRNGSGIKASITDVNPKLHLLTMVLRNFPYPMDKCPWLRLTIRYDLYGI